MGLMYFTPEQVEYLRQGFRQMHIPELTEAYNERFGTDYTPEQIKSATRNHRLRSGRITRFGGAGFQPWNTGTKGTGVCKGSSTSFKTGSVPANRKPLWSERINAKDGYIYISIPERNPHTGHSTRYVQKHIWVWKQAHGPVPKGHCVIFLDGDKYNCEPDNLTLVTRAELLALNLHRYAEAPPELKPSVMALAKLEANAGIRTYHARRRAQEKKAEHGR